MPANSQTSLPGDELTGIFSPSRPLSPPGSVQGTSRSSDVVTVSSGLLGTYLPKIPNLQFGFVYSFGTSIRQSRWSLDYLLPMGSEPGRTFFVELHGDSTSYKNTATVPLLNNFWRLGKPGTQTRTDLSVGGGYRRILHDNVLLGVNAFYDAGELFGNWRSAGGVGIEMAANGPGDAAVDINFNYYSNIYGSFNSRGSVFPTFNIVDGIKNWRGNFDVECGYSQPLFNYYYDLRIKLVGYQYDFGNSRKHGLQTGAELMTADGYFKLAAAYGHDDVVGSYGNVGGYLNVGLQLENLFKGESPFTAPEPVFRSPRNLTKWLTRPVRRNWNRPESLVANSHCEGMPDDSAFSTPRDKSCFYLGFSQGAASACGNAGLIIMQYSYGGGWTWVNNEANQYPAPPYDYKRDVDPMWDCASAAFARAASGVVHAYIYTPRLYDYASTFHRIELPTLQNNPNVTSVLIYDGFGPDPSAYTFVGDWKYGVH